MFERQDHLIYADSQRDGTSGNFLGAVFGWVLLIIVTIALIVEAVRYCIDTVISFFRYVDGYVQPIISYWPF